VIYYFFFSVHALKNVLFKPIFFRKPLRRDKGRPDFQPLLKAVFLQPVKTEKHIPRIKDLPAARKVEFGGFFFFWPLDEEKIMLIILIFYLIGIQVYFLFVYQGKYFIVMKRQMISAWNHTITTIANLLHIYLLYF